MKLSQVQIALSAAARLRRAAFLWGQPGIGKSDVVRQTAAHAAQALGYTGVAEYGDRHENIKAFFGLHDVRLSQCEPVDIRGLPVPSGDTTKWLVPDWFPHTGRDDLPSSGILFLDEANAAPPSVQAAAYQITLDRRIGDRVMKPGWSVVLAGNRLTDGGVTFKMPKPLCNRLIHLDVEVNVDEWRGWAMDNNIPVEIVAFIGFRPDLLNTFEEHVTKKLEGNAFCTPRSWAIAADLIGANLPADVRIDMLNGTLGSGPTAELTAFMQVWQNMPSIDGILLDPAGAPVPEDSATLFAVSAALAARANKDTMDQLVAYMCRMPAEFSVLTAKDMQRRHGATILATPGFVTWATKHAHLLGV